MHESRCGRRALALLVGCTFTSTQVRKRAANDFGCPEDEIVVTSCRPVPRPRLQKQADYLVQDGR